MSTVSQSPESAALMLRETPAATAWINQFDPADRPYASLLLESLELVPALKLERALMSLIADEVKQVRKGAVAIFAVREVRAEEEDEAVGEQTNSRTHATGQDQQDPPAAEAEAPKKSTPKRKRRPTVPSSSPAYFDLVNEELRPDAVGAGGGVGSEGDIAHLIRDLATRHGNRVLDHPSIHAMRSTKTRLLLLVDDVIASGTRMTAFIRSVTSDKRIRSWYSYGYVKVCPVAYAATRVGLALVEAQKRQDRVRYERRLSEGSPAWSDAQHEEIKRICRKYADRTSRPGMSLGYKQAFTTIVFEHKCPNTNPAILWAGSKTWKPLFEERPKLGFPDWPISSSEETQLRRVLVAVGQPKLAAANLQSVVKPGARLRLLVLAATARKIRRPEAIAALVQISIPLARQLLNECAQLGWLTWNYHLTLTGRQELQHARTLGAGIADNEELDRPLTYTPAYYFPKQLRGSRKAT